MAFARHKNNIVRALAVLCAFAASAAAAAAPEVQRFTPQGEAKGVRQVTARSASPSSLSAIRASPILSPCSATATPRQAKGRGRWADTRNWVYDFEADLPAGQRCRFTLKRRLQGAERPAARRARASSASTPAGPAVMASLPREGDESIDEEQVFLLALDAPIDTASLNGAWCEAAGINERIPLKLVPEKETREILEANRYARLQPLQRLYARRPRRRCRSRVSRSKTSAGRTCRSSACAARSACPQAPTVDARARPAGEDRDRHRALARRSGSRSKCAPRSR